jgi:phosphoribosylformimino-5-aminoimidazole carboxamide ribonucleotide (ProFAR) isomerase
MSLLLIPAIDLKDGDCVRLRQGDLADATVFSKDPGEMAAQWVKQGAQRIHVVDLNGAVAGRPKNESAIRAIVKAVGNAVPVQVGGGIRDLAMGRISSLLERLQSRTPAFSKTHARHFLAKLSSRLTRRTAKLQQMAGANSQATR